MTAFDSRDLIPLFIYLFLLLYLGFKSRRKNADQEEFLLSGRSLSIPAFVATLVTTWYGGILGVGEFVYTYGVAAWFVLGLPYYFFAFLFALFLAPKIRRSGTYSIPDMLYQTYGKKSAVLGSLFLIVMTSPAPYILMIGILLQQILGLNFIVSVITGTVFSILYVFWGGFRSVVQTDKLQFLFMFGGFVFLLFFLLQSPVSFLQLPDKLDTLHKSISGGLSVQQLIVWVLIASWTFIDPGFHQRCAAARSPQVARKGILISIVFWFIFDMLTLISGLYAFVLLPGITPLMAYPELAGHILPPVLRGLFFTGLLAIIMSTIDSYTFLSAMTISRDFLGKISARISIDDQDNRLVKTGLLITAIIAILLIIYIPSVIELWYNLGNLFIPPLLLPLIAAYIPAMRISGKSTFIIMILSFIMSFSSFIIGRISINQNIAEHPFGLEPFFPGMLISILGYALIIFFNKIKP